MVPFPLPEAKVRPSGLKATELTEAECPVRVFSNENEGELVMTLIGLLGNKP